MTSTAKGPATLGEVGRAGKMVQGSADLTVSEYRKLADLVHHNPTAQPLYVYDGRVFTGSIARVTGAWLAFDGNDNVIGTTYADRFEAKGAVRAHFIESSRASAS